MKTHLMSWIKVRSPTAYRILLINFGEMTMELDALKLSMDYEQRLTNLHLSWVVKQIVSLSQHLAQIDKNTESIVGLALGETHRDNEGSYLMSNEQRAVSGEQ